MGKANKQKAKKLAKKRAKTLLKSRDDDAMVIDEETPSAPLTGRQKHAQKVAAKRALRAAKQDIQQQRWAIPKRSVDRKAERKQRLTARRRSKDGGEDDQDEAGEEAEAGEEDEAGELSFFGTSSTSRMANKSGSAKWKCRRCCRRVHGRMWLADAPMVCGSTSTLTNQRTGAVISCRRRLKAGQLIGVAVSSHGSVSYTHLTLPTKA